MKYNILLLYIFMYFEQNWTCTRPLTSVSADAVANSFVDKGAVQWYAWSEKEPLSIFKLNCNFFLDELCFLP